MQAVLVMTWGKMALHSILPAQKHTHHHLRATVNEASGSAPRTANLGFHLAQSLLVTVRIQTCHVSLGDQALHIQSILPTRA